MSGRRWRRCRPVPARGRVSCGVLPAVARGARHVAQLDQLALAGALGVGRQRQQVGQQAVEPLGLALGGLDVAPHAGIARLVARGLQPQPQPGQRRAQLV